MKYANAAPWPLAADGVGPSLQRLHPTQYGDDPVNWTAAYPTPGGPFGGGTLPRITSQPVSETVVAYTDTSLSVAAENALSYQWRFLGKNLFGATNATLLLTNIQPEQAGDYFVLAFNAAGTVVSSNATLQLLIPPTVTLQPRSQGLRGSTNVLTYGQTGTNVTFSVGAFSSLPMGFQWQFKGTDVAGATNRSLTVTNVTLADEGPYTVSISNSLGSRISAPATLAVLINPTITRQPEPQTAVVGDTVSFSVDAIGTQPFGYNWRRNGATVATFRLGLATLTITNVQTRHAGNYTVVITNSANLSPGVTSANAVLTVLADTDGDHIPDVWELANGLDPNNPNDALIDSDGDGMNNWQEYIAGTDPQDPSSYFKIDQLTAGPNALWVSFMAVSNKTYTVEYRDALEAGSWFKLIDVGTRATNHVETVPDPKVGIVRRFYRLVTPAKP